MLPAESVEAQPIAVCPEHPERPSVATCERCGRFLCLDCAVSRHPPRCGPCDARLRDPHGFLAQPFGVDTVLLNGWKLFIGTFPRALPIALVIGVPGGLFSLAVSPHLGLVATVRATQVFDMVFGLIGTGALLALMTAYAEGADELPSLTQALSRGLHAWPRMFAARFNAGIRILLFCLLFLIPGFVKAVSFSLVIEASFREPRHNPLESSTRLTAGRRWEVFGLFLASYFLVAITTIPLGFLSVSAGEMLPTAAPFLEVAVEVLSRIAEAFATGVGLAAFYGLKRSQHLELEPLPLP